MGCIILMGRWFIIFGSGLVRVFFGTLSGGLPRGGSVDRPFWTLPFLGLSLDTLVLESTNRRSVSIKGLRSFNE